MAALPNKPGEPEFQLKVEPQSLLFKGKLKEEQVVVEVKITNTTKDRQAYKVLVKCTSNEVFRVCRPLGYIKPSESVTIKIMYHSSKPVPDPKKQYFAIYHFKSDEEKKTAREGNVKIEGIKRIPCTFEDTTDGGKEEDKKEEPPKEKSVMKTQIGNADDKDEKKEEEKKK